jgi:hypothetical protein
MFLSKLSSSYNYSNLLSRKRPFKNNGTKPSMFIIELKARCSDYNK